MKGPGILWMLQTAAGFSMAGPMFIVGLGFLRSGRPVAGIGFLAFGAVALYFPTYLIKRIGGPRTWIERRLDRGTTDDGGDRVSDADSTDGSEADTRGPSLLDRLR